MSKKNVKNEQKSFIESAYAPLKGFSQARSGRMVPRQEEWDRFRGELSCNLPQTEALFEPKKGETIKSKKARELCKICPLFFVCGEQEILDPSNIGIKNAMTERERAGLRSAVDGKLLNSVAELGLENPNRKLFYEITQVVLGVVALNEMTIQEATEEIKEIHARAQQPTDTLVSN